MRGLRRFLILLHRYLGIPLSFLFVIWFASGIAMIYVGVHPTSVAWAIAHVRAGAQEAGRDPDAVEIALLTAMHVGDDLDAARDACRWAPAACA